MSSDLVMTILLYALLRPALKLGYAYMHIFISSDDVMSFCLRATKNRLRVLLSYGNPFVTNVTCSREVEIDLFAHRIPSQFQHTVIKSARISV